MWKAQNIRTKLRVVRSCIFPIATYGCESWSLRKMDEKKIQAFEMNTYRRILRVPWTARRTNESIRDELNVKDNWLLNFIIRQKLTYFGHVKRHDGLERLVMEGIVQGRGRRRGRPKIRWEKDIRDRLGSITEAGRLAQNRTVFRAVVRDATS